MAEAERRGRAEVFRQELETLVRVHETKMMSEAAAAARTASAQVGNAAALFLNDGLTLRCPGCKAAVLDWDGCCAVTCGT